MELGRCSALDHPRGNCEDNTRVDIVCGFDHEIERRHLAGDYINFHLVSNAGCIFCRFGALLSRCCSLPCLICFVESRGGRSSFRHCFWGRAGRWWRGHKIGRYEFIFFPGDCLLNALRCQVWWCKRYFRRAADGLHDALRGKLWGNFVDAWWGQVLSSCWCCWLAGHGHRRRECFA